MCPLLDSHIHLDAPELQGCGAELLPQARQRGIAGFVIPGVRSSGWQGLIALAEQQQGVYAAPGLHPAYADQWNADTQVELQQLCSHPRVVAIGEIGLDGVAGPELVRQEQVLRAQLLLALDSGLPVLLHGRKATGRLLEILREYRVGQQIGGVWHGFSGSLQIARELVRLGLKIGVGPILLRASARRLPQAVVDLPLAALLLETDLPDMAEQPEVLITVAERVAELRGCRLEEVAEVTTANACELFGIDETGL